MVAIDAFHDLCGQGPRAVACQDAGPAWVSETNKSHNEFAPTQWAADGFAEGIHPPFSNRRGSV